SSLENLLNEEGDKLELADAVFICLEVCRGLEKAYFEFGLPHLALGPKNVFITGDGRIKFQDYGVSAYIQKEHFYSQVRNLHEYLVPEAFFQWKIEDFRSDFYLLSCLLYRMITGRNPQANFSPVRPSDFELFFSIPERRSLGNKFLRIFDLMSAPDPQDRFSSHDALINALSSYLNSNNGSRNRRLTTFENLDLDFSHLV
ncbi:MAG: protein kinase, partial [Lentisphaeraceae bacterium]|nr:protein kinase [Lentisphaeraceae bacterium]